MKTMTKWKNTQPGSTEAVQFSDGMLVTAEDLTAAMGYPLAVVQVLLKAFFGCGVLCGLGLKDAAQERAREAQARRNPATGEQDSAGSEPEPNYILIVDRGVALGCDGYPIEICKPLRLDLGPDRCREYKEDKELFIATRRVTAAEAAPRACGCGSTGGGGPAEQCTRMRDHTLVQAFEEPPAGMCCLPEKVAAVRPREGAVPAERLTGAAAICACLKQCGECACAGESWVLLGSVWVGPQGLGPIDETRRRYVKPIACACHAAEPGNAAGNHPAVPSRAAPPEDTREAERQAEGDGQSDAAYGDSAEGDGSAESAAGGEGTAEIGGTADGETQE